MYLNFRFGSGRRCLRIVNGQAAIDTWAGPSWSGSGWCGYRPISLALARRFLRHPAALEALRSEAAWGAWQEVVDAVGVGPEASAAYGAVAHV